MIRSQTAVAFNPGPANLQYIDSKKYVARQFGPVNTMGNDIFEDSITAALGIDTRFVDDWDDYHRLDGEVHCGSIVKREALAFDWWDTP